MAEKIKLEYEKKDGGYYFPQVDIHVKANTLEQAKEVIKTGHGLDLDAHLKWLNEQQKN